MKSVRRAIHNLVKQMAHTLNGDFGSKKFDISAPAKRPLIAPNAQEIEAEIARLKRE